MRAKEPHLVGGSKFLSYSPLVTWSTRNISSVAHYNLYGETRAYSNVDVLHTTYEWAHAIPIRPCSRLM